VFAGCLNSEGTGAVKLKSHRNVLVVQLDITSDEEVAAALDYVSQNLPPQGEYKVTTEIKFMAVYVHTAVFCIVTVCSLVGGGYIFRIPLIFVSKLNRAVYFNLCNKVFTTSYMLQQNSAIIIKVAATNMFLLFARPMGNSEQCWLEYIWSCGMGANPCLSQELGS
jgi:hypothetical protein